MEIMEGLKNKRVIVTGGAGFIGGHLVRRLIKEGARVWVFDIDYSQGSYTSFSPLMKKAVIETVDITDRLLVTKKIQSIRPDFLYHLAAEAIVNNSYKDPYRTFQTNIMGTVHILEALRLVKDIQGVIVASSDKAYGKTKKAYTEETALQGDHPYDVSKSSADLIAHAYYITYGLPVVVTRFGNVYGEGDFHFDRLIPGICKAIVDKSVLGLRSDGTFVRDYVYVSDVVDGYIFLAKQIQKTKGEAYNFSSSNTMSVVEVVHKFEKILGHTISIDIVNNQKNEIPYQHLIDKKIKALGWKNSYTLEQTLQSVLAWYTKVLQQNT